MKKLNNIHFSTRFKYGYYQFFDHFLIVNAFLNGPKTTEENFIKTLPND